MRSRTFLFSAILATLSVSLATDEVDSNPVVASGGDGNHLTPAENLTSGRIHGPFQLQQLLAYPNVRAGGLKRAAEADLVCFISNTQACDKISEFARCLLLPTSAGDTCFLNPGCTIRLVECPPRAVPSEEAAGKPHLHPGNLSPFPTESQITLSLGPASSPKLELKDMSPKLLGARGSKSIAEQVDAAIPDSVKEAILNRDPKVAAQVLAKEFSGNALPQWYENMPASVKNYYATITTPPMMSAMATDKPTVTTNNHQNVRRSDSVVDGWVSSIRSYESLISQLSRSARKNSLDANEYASIASSESRRATSFGDGFLQTSASQLSIVGSSKSFLAVSQSRAASSASSLAYPSRKVASTTSSAAAPARYQDVAWYSSTFGSVVCFVMALFL